MMADQLKFDKKIVKITNYVALNNAPLKKIGALSNATWFWSFDEYFCHIPYFPWKLFHGNLLNKFSNIILLSTVQ